MRHTRGKPYHPMTQGKIERWHLSLKSRILLENYYLPGGPEHMSRIAMTSNLAVGFIVGSCPSSRFSGHRSV